MKLTVPAFQAALGPAVGKQPPPLELRSGSGFPAGDPGAEMYVLWGNLLRGAWRQQTGCSAWYTAEIETPLPPTGAGIYRRGTREMRR